MAPVYGCLYAGAGRLVVGRFGAAYFVELAVVDLHKLDYCSSFQCHGFGKREVTAISDGGGVVAAIAVDCVDGAGNSVGQVGNRGGLSVFAGHEHGSVGNAGRGGVVGEHVGGCGGCAAADFDKLAVCSFHQRDNVAGLGRPFFGNEVEFTGFLDSNTVVAVGAALDVYDFADFCAFDVVNLLHLLVIAGNNRVVEHG